MITVPTVLVLGAGASSHLDYPLGQALINQLSNLRDHEPSMTDLGDRFGRQEVLNFLTRLSRSGHYSIDAFLASTAPQELQLGKYLIAFMLKRCEVTNRMFPPHASGWYQYLFNSLLDRGRVRFAANTLSIVTFNYDRSLEAYLSTVLHNRFGIAPDEAAEIIATIPIIHVHGQLGGFPEVPYATIADHDRLLAISRRIHILHELNSDNGTFANSMFQDASERLAAAERVYFLGMGWHEENIARLRFFGHVDTSKKDIHGTTLGMHGIATTSLRERLTSLGAPGVKLQPYDCNTFFAQCASLT